MTAFGWHDARDQLADFAARWRDAAADAAGRAFVGGAAERPARLWLPAVLPPARPGEWVAHYRARLPDGIGRQCVLLLRAGAAALGYWDEDALLRHKALRRYVVRGAGRAQPTHLKTRGKSRYGSRLRLQNWQRLLTSVNERLAAWSDELGEPARVHYAIPVRSVAELFAARPQPPWPRDDARWTRIALHVHQPDHEELLAVRAQLARGRLELPRDEPTARA